MEISMDELLEVSNDAIDLLRKKGNPYMSIVISDSQVEIVSKKVVIPLQNEQ